MNYLLLLISATLGTVLCAPVLASRLYLHNLESTPSDGLALGTSDKSRSMSVPPKGNGATFTTSDMIRESTPRLTAEVTGAEGASPQLIMVSPAVPRIAAWYIADPSDIPPLEKKGFNLFFIGKDLSHQASEAQDAEIHRYIDALGPDSQIVLSIQPWLRRNWFSGVKTVPSCQDTGGQPQRSTSYPVPGKTTAGLEDFINRWGGSDPQYRYRRERIYGFLLADDVQLTPFGEKCSSQPRNGLWVVQWTYNMIRNKVEGQRNGPNRDLAPNKKLIVTMPFNPNYNSRISSRVNMGDFAIPPSFFTPGVAFDVVAPYYYPHQKGTNENQQIANMNVIYPEMARLFPSPRTRMPILQATGGCSSLASQPDIRIQLDRMRTHGLGRNDVGVIFFTARWLAECNTLLQYGGQKLATDANPYYRSAGIVNGYLLNTPIGPEQ